VIGAFFAGIAGGLYAHHKAVISPSGFDFIKSIEIVVMVIMGGMGRTAGVILAAIILTILPELLPWCRRVPDDHLFAAHHRLDAHASAGPVHYLAQEMSALLECEKVTIKFGGPHRRGRLDLRIGEQELVGLIGPNGAGKTTAFNLITGVYQPTSGSIRFGGRPTANVKPHTLSLAASRAPSKTSASSRR
jgi:ABC-type transport system involved in cytochrome bd biosynthesis fused ATPase/permease subunit